MSKIVLLTVLLLAALPAAMWATGIETFSILKFAVFFGPLAVVVAVIFISRRPAWTIYSGMLFLFPFLGLIMPPARLGMTAFHFLAALLLVLALASQLTRENQWMPLFSRELRALWLPLLLLVPTVVFAIDIQRSLIEWVALWGYYATFVVGAHYLSDERNLQISQTLLATSLAIIALAIIIQKAAGISLSWLYSERGAESTGGMLIRRGSGLFQDPQKAGQVLAMLIAFLTVTWQRHSVPRGWRRLLVAAAVILAIPALLLTVSRLAIVMGLFCFAVGFVVLGRQSVPVRMLAWICGLAVVIIGAGLWGSSTLVDMLPVDLQKRALAVDESVSVRLSIWANTFHFYTDNPLVGIGPGNYREYYLLENHAFAAAARGFSAMAVPDQPESGYLKVLYEVGTFGFLAALSIAAYMFRLISANIQSTLPDVVSRGWAMALALGAFFVTFGTLFTTSDSRNAFLLVFFLSMAYADQIRVSKRAAASGPRALPREPAFRSPLLRHYSNRKRLGTP